MSNTRAWRAKTRTSKPSSRQKRNGLFLDERPICQACTVARSVQAHHDLPRRHPDRYDHRYMRALCEPCHVEVHQTGSPNIISPVFIPNGGQMGAQYDRAAQKGDST